MCFAKVQLCRSFCLCKPLRFLFFQGAFLLLLGPFVFFNVQKTKYLQLFTTLMRWLGVYKAFQMCKNSFSYRCYPQTKTPFSSKTTSEVGVLLNLRVIFNEFCTNSEIRKKGCGFLRSPLGGSKSPNENISLLQRSV